MQRFLVLGAATLCLGLAAQGADRFSTYVNARFGYSVFYPANLLTPRPEAPNGDGRVFKSRDGRITLSVWGQHNALNRTLRAQMNAARNDWVEDRARVTYWKMGQGYYVLSGLTGDQIFYEKTVARGDGYATILWQYPQSQKAKLDAVVTRSTRAFGGTERMAKHVERAPRGVARRSVEPDTAGY